MAGHRVNFDIESLVLAIKFFDTIALPKETVKELFQIASNDPDCLLSDPMSLMFWETEINAQMQNGIIVKPSQRLVELFVKHLDEDLAEFDDRHYGLDIYHVNFDIESLVRAIKFYDTISLPKEAIEELYRVAKDDPMSLLFWAAKINDQMQNCITIGPSMRLHMFFVAGY